MPAQPATHTPSPAACYRRGRTDSIDANGSQKGSPASIQPDLDPRVTKSGDGPAFLSGCPKKKKVGPRNLLTVCPWKPQLVTVSHLGVRKKKGGSTNPHATCPWRSNLTPRQPASPAVHAVYKLTTMTQGRLSSAARSLAVQPDSASYNKQQSGKPTGQEPGDDYPN